MKYLINMLLSLIYPNRCIFCDEIIPMGEDEYICKYCNMDIDYVYNDEDANICVFYYDNITRYSILRLKYYEQRQYAKTFAKMMYEKMIRIDLKGYDYIICVPMHKKKKKKRGYDQAEEIGKELSKLTNIQLEKDNLIRIKNTLPQSKVSFEDRRKNVKGVFKVLKPEVIKDKNILLIDDIYTTGSTIKYCKEELKNAGAKEVCCFTLAKVIYNKNLEI